MMSEAGLAQKSQGRWVPAPLGIISWHPLSATHFRDGKTEGKNLSKASQPGYRVEPAGPHSPYLPRAAQVCTMGTQCPPRCASSSRVSPFWIKRPVLGPVVTL